MPIVEKIETDGAVPVFIWTDDLDEIARRQLMNVAGLPFVFNHVSAMPDVHAGMGATIGSVIATKQAVIPAAVGVDIGCGMLAVKTNLTKADINTEKLQRAMKAIMRRTPVGLRQFSEKNMHVEAIGSFEEQMREMQQKEPLLLAGMKTMTWQQEIGTLGGGNHFIELTLDEENNLWIMLHSGSRGVGNVMAAFYIQKAKKEIKERGITLPDPALSYFEEGTESFDDYMKAVSWAQRYAMVNRSTMLADIVKSMRDVWPDVILTSEVINCHHNYVEKELHFGEEVYVTRKGAIRARKGEWGIIPGSMGTKSYIVQGLGNPDSFMSSSHGAGRRMSRMAAKKTFSTVDIERQTDGVVCRKDIGVVDEIPGAYKDIEKVIENQKDLTEIRYTLKQVLCVKG